MTKIDAAKYQGYLWMSDQKKPSVFLGDTSVPEITLDDNANPFIIEGNLYDADRQESISIRFADGRYIVAKYSLGNIGKDESVTEEYYLTNEKIKREVGDGRKNECVFSLYKRIWKAEQDALNGNREVLRPWGLAFAGFFETSNE